jgi:signal transduction histidine kinase
MAPRWGRTVPAPAGDPAEGPAGADRTGRRTVALQVGQFAAAGLVALLVVGFGLSIAARRVGEREAITNARATTVVKAQGVVEPAITDGLVRGDRAAMERVDEVVRRDVLDESLVRVRIWTPEGEVVYSDEPRSIGGEYQLGADELESLRTGLIEAEVSDLSKPENQYERGFGKLLEVYLPIRSPDGEPLLFEAYYRYDAVEEAGADLWRSFAPIAIGALVLLEVVQIALAWSLARRLRQRQREREGLLRRALEASEVERRQIAADLHDGVVQDLAGVHYALAAAARSENGGGNGDREMSLVLDDSATTVRESIKVLRSLLVEIYPPDLEEEGLASTLSDLLARPSGRGVEAELDTTALQEPLPTAVAGLLYRVAQEGVRNALNHADPRTLCVRVSSDDRVAAIEVIDDGRGFEIDGDVAAPADGHFGLRGLAGLVADAGGTLDVRSAPGEGTTLRVEVPL